MMGIIEAHYVYSVLSKVKNVGLVRLIQVNQTQQKLQNLLHKYIARSEMSAPRDRT
jgi:hypothetical protein